MTWDLYVKAIGSLVFVLGLIGGAAYLMRRFGPAGSLAIGRNRRRLVVVETLSLDNRRRLMLVRRDGAEHLLLVGGGADLVIERGVAAFAEQLRHQDEAAS